ncbi:MAG: 16S rRNA (cytosine(1402)-N(4))-methyltransferase RsmH [Bacteroidia bacterium]|nr:16S rRNA (cytosine(1402)-N(4))-methyltransferase RsmH [Bacteroidia bacterium]
MILTEKNKYHIPVMLPECLDGLQLKRDGFYVDATYGGGGHSRAILEAIPDGKLFAFDQDDDAAQSVVDADNLVFVNQNFQFIKNFLKFYEVNQVDGILADLGVSSHQIDEAERGFSFRYDADLDMRMNQQQRTSAKDVVNNYSAEELSQIFKLYGEIRYAWKLANKIVAVRKGQPITTTGQLADIMDEFTIPKQRNRELAQLFQAIRIEVNDELGVLRRFLEQCLDVLKPGGRLVIMSYHSLEDRLVKTFINSGNFEGKVETDPFGRSSAPFKVITRKPITPNEVELIDNPRSRSAKLRIAEKR